MMSAVCFFKNVGDRGMGRNKDKIILTIGWEWLKWNLGYVGVHYPIFSTFYNNYVELSKTKSFLKCSKHMNNVISYSFKNINYFEWPILWGIKL